MKPTTIVHLLSGGLDSTVLLYDLRAQNHKVHCLLFDYGQRHVQELTFAKYHCRKLGVMFTTLQTPTLLGSSLTRCVGGVVVPNRNAVLLSIAANFAVEHNAEVVSYACNKDDEAMFPDCRMAFVQAFNMMLQVQEIGVEIYAPYQQTSKRDIVKIGRRLTAEIAQTWSCYQGGAKPCGKCEACKRREEALA